MRMAAPDGTTTSTLVSWVLTGCRVRPQGTIDLHGSAHRWSDTRVCSKAVTITLLPGTQGFDTLRCQF